MQAYNAWNVSATLLNTSIPYTSTDARGLSSLPVLGAGRRLDRTPQHRYGSRRQIYVNFFWASGYDVGSTVMDLVDEVSSMDWRSTFPAGGTPMSILETLYDPLGQQDIDALVAAAQAAYDWPSILAQVEAIPPEYLD